MVSKTSADWPGQRLDHAAFAEKLSDRREKAGQPDLPRNAGNRRTDSKRALLDAIARTGKVW